MSTYAWLVLAFPLGGMLVIAGTWRLLPQRLHGVIGTLAIALSFVSAVLLFTKLHGSDVKQVTVHGWDYAKTVGLDAEISLLVDPLSVFMALVVSGSCSVSVASRLRMTSDTDTSPVSGTPARRRARMTAPTAAISSSSDATSNATR